MEGEGSMGVGVVNNNCGAVSLENASMQLLKKMHTCCITFYFVTRGQ